MTVRKLFEQLEAERAAGRVFTLRDWLAEHPLPDDAFTQTLAGVAERTRRGEPFFPAVRELLDELGLTSRSEQRRRAISERPEPTGEPRHDAYLAALAEHIATADGLERPAWCLEPDRFLDRFWFPSPIQGFRPLAMVESPAAFRRRGIFISGGALQRC